MEAQYWLGGPYGLYGRGLYGGLGYGYGGLGYGFGRGFGSGRASTPNTPGTPNTPNSAVFEEAGFGREMDVQGEPEAMPKVKQEKMEPSKVRPRYLTLAYGNYTVPVP